MTAIELIEHLPKKSLSLFERNVFGFIKPQLVVISTPNYDFNYWFHYGIKEDEQIKEEEEEEGKESIKWFRKKKKYFKLFLIRPFRHPDHKFEFTQSEFRD